MFLASTFEPPHRPHNVLRGEIDAGGILAPICHEHKKGTAYARTEKDSGAKDMNIFEHQVIHDRHFSSDCNGNIL